MEYLINTRSVLRKSNYVQDMMIFQSKILFASYRYRWCAFLNMAVNRSATLLFQSGFRYLLRTVFGYKSLQRFLIELCHARIENWTLIS